MSYYKKWYDEPEQYYAYHDIDMHKDQILKDIKKDGLTHFRYVVKCSALKDEECVAPGYNVGSKVRIWHVVGDNIRYSGILTVKNPEIYNAVNELGIAIAPKLQDNFGLDFDGDIVGIKEVK